MCVEKTDGFLTRFVPEASLFYSKRKRKMRDQRNDRRIFRPITFTQLTDNGSFSIILVE